MFIIEKGVMQEDGEAFIKFKREHIQVWGTISLIISQLEKWIGQYIVKHANISGLQLVKLALLDQEKYSKDDLMLCITNQRQVFGIIHNPKKMYKGPGGPKMAAVNIQKTWRYFKAYSDFKQLKFLMSQATIIQRRYRLWQLKN